MGSHHKSTDGTERTAKRHVVQKLYRLVVLGLAITAVVKEVRTPAQERTWHGVVAGFVPYDFRVPTLARLRERVWNPESEHLVGPRAFGVGWTLNAGRLVALARERVAAAG
ncbi:DUF5808 domain-containing protein [Pengzhenrongella sicca]|uniref:DUF5808 domain-containing protein n=1 Tax=Pengzhenrongella sicca TaxID=2819238 RepID=A0A8A4ZFZ4_9MICO|nr:DUF5808 domain-containing protein [Pengzhenrongella sicca]QTE30942.1 hypothetical protein J4E96_08460 [Pengzhenrongella sicca]